MSKYNDKAVALKYRKDKDKAPIIVASGAGDIAQRIIKIADSNGIPVYRDSATTTLLSQFKIGKEIPRELYEVVASIYACILETANEIKGKQKQPIYLENESIARENNAGDYANDEFVGTKFNNE